MIEFSFSRVAAISLALSIPLFAEEDKNAAPAEGEKTSVVAIYDIEGLVTEAGQPAPGVFGPDFSQGMPLAMLDLSLSLAAARDNDEVKAVVVDVDQAWMNLAQIEEFRRGLMEIRDAGKDVWVYTDYYSFGTALVGSAATKFAMMPEGMVSFRGLYAESMYLKGALDKIGVEAEVVHIGDFKSFGEQLYREGPSEAAQQQTDELMDGLYELLTSEIADGRSIDRAAVVGAINNGRLAPQDLVDAKLVDELAHRTDFIERIENSYGDDVEYDWAYEMEDRSGPKIEGFMDLMKVMFSSNKDIGGGEPYIAVVALEGGIDDDSIAPLREIIRKVTLDEDALGLILRVDSPGGSALSSEVLWEVLEEWKETDAPFAVSMGGVAASGGYYVSAGADRIFAEKGTITGSIGVVGMKLVTGDAFSHLGITVHADKRGEHADLYSSTAPFTDEQRAIVRESMEEVYGTFLKHVREGRGENLSTEVEKLAGGRVYTGARALELGLVDEIGGLGDALRWMRGELGEPKIKAILLPRPQSPFDALFGQQEDNDDELISMKAAPRSGKGIVAELRRSFVEAGLFPVLSASQRESLQQALNQLEAAGSPGIQLLSPPLPVLR